MAEIIPVKLLKKHCETLPFSCLSNPSWQKMFLESIEVDVKLCFLFIHKLKNIKGLMMNTILEEKKNKILEFVQDLGTADLDTLTELSEEYGFKDFDIKGFSKSNFFRCREEELKAANKKRTISVSLKKFNDICFIKIDCSDLSEAFRFDARYFEYIKNEFSLLGNHKKIMALAHLNTLGLFN